MEFFLKRFPNFCSIHPFSLTHRVLAGVLSMSYATVDKSSSLLKRKRIFIRIAKLSKNDIVVALNMRACCWCYLV